MLASRLTHTSYVVDFLGVGFSTRELSAIIEPIIDDNLSSVLGESLDSWRLVVNALYTNSDHVYLYRKVRPFKSGPEMHKEIIIHIPIPMKNIVDWGVNENQQLSLVAKYSDKYADKIEVDPTQFECRKEFIIHCLTKGIQTAFRLGFVINSIKVKNENA